MSTVVDFSQIESEVLGLRVGRCNNDFFDESVLRNQILNGSYDICRLKVPAEDEMASHRLHRMGFPFFFSGSIRRYKTKISGPPAGTYNFPDLVFEMYDGSQDLLLKKMLVGTWGTYPIGYYRTPYLSSLVSKEAEIDSVFQYYKKYNLNRNNPANSIVFIRHGKDYVGFFALNILNGNLESHIGGILEPYRKSGYFLDKLRYIREYCVRYQLEHFIFGARNENAEVQRIFQHVGFQPHGCENVFHIPSLLTHTHRPPVERDIKIIKPGVSGLYQSLLAESLTIAEMDTISGTKISFRINRLSHHSVSAMKIRFSFPISNSNEHLIVLREISDSRDLLVGYLAIHG